MVRVFIFSGVRSYRDALEQSLDDTGHVEVVGSAGHPLDAISELDWLKPDVTLLDLPGPEGPRGAAELRSLLPGTRVIALGLAEAEHEVIAWAEAGVAGYLGREASLAELVTAIEGAVLGEATCSARTSAILLRRIAAGPDAPVPAWKSERHLTSREREILQLAGQGLSNQQIARRLFIAVPTVKNHMHNILEKLGVHRRTDALREVRRGGFVLGGGPVAS
jgi:DNA-binding NarL/FixJ family response regulator